MGKAIEHLSDLTPDPRNARAHNPRNVGMIESALNEVGAARSIVIDEDGIVLAGNATIEAAAQAGIERVHVVEADGETIIAVRRSGLTPEQKVKLALFDNRAAELADWDPAIMAELKEEIDLSHLFSTDELSALLADVGQPEIGGGGDEFDPVLPEGPTRTAPGDLWSITGNGLTHRLIVGDCTDPLVVERLMGEEEISCVFTSPPYDQQRTYEGNMALDWRALVSGALLLATQHCASDAQLFVNLGLVHRDGRVVRYWDNLINDMEDGGWPLFGWYVWDKLNGMPGDWNGRLAPAHEWVFHFTSQPRRHSELRKTVKTKHEGRKVGRTERYPDGSLKPFNSPGLIQPYKIPDSVVRLSPQKPDVLVSDHPAPFPVALPETFLQAYAGDLWYDPFLGSGTSIIAAERAGRRCVGAEINPRYADLVLARAEAASLTCTRE